MLTLNVDGKIYLPVETDLNSVGYVKPCFQFLNSTSENRILFN